MPKEWKKKLGGAPKKVDDVNSNSSLFIEAEIGEEVREVDLHAMSRAEALSVVEKLVDDAFMAGERVVRVVHGDGTGALRQAVRDYLEREKLVDAWQPAPYPHASGVTLAIIAKGRS